MANNNKAQKPSMLAEAGRGMAFFSMLGGVFVGVIFILVGFFSFFSQAYQEEEATVDEKSDASGTYPYSFIYDGNPYPGTGRTDTTKDKGDTITVHFPKGKPRQSKVGTAPSQAAIGSVAIVIGIVIAGASYGMYTLAKKSNTMASGFAAMSALSAFSD